MHRFSLLQLSSILKVALKWELFWERWLIHWEQRHVWSWPEDWRQTLGWTSLVSLSRSGHSSCETSQWHRQDMRHRHWHTCFSRLGKNSCLTCSTQWRQSLGRHRCYNLLCRHTHIFWPNFPFYRACKLFFKCKPLIKIIFFSVKPFFPTFFLSILLIEQFLNFVPQTNAHNRWEKTICAQNNSVEGHQISTIAAQGEQQANNVEGTKEFELCSTQDLALKCTSYTSLCIMYVTTCAHSVYISPSYRIVHISNPPFQSVWRSICKACPSPPISFPAYTCWFLATIWKMRRRGEEQFRRDLYFCNI